MLCDVGNLILKCKMQLSENGWIFAKLRGEHQNVTVEAKLHRVRYWISLAL